MRHLRLGSVLCAAALAAVACGRSKSRLGPQAQQVVARKVTGALFDARSQQLILLPAEITLRDGAGQLSTVTRDGAGRAIGRVTTSSGVFGFAIADAAQLPQRVVVVATVPGYASSSAHVDVAANGEQTVVMRLVDVRNPPSGVAAAVLPAGDASATGQLAGPVSITTPTSGSAGGTTRLDIPASTVVTSASGQPLVGALSATITYFNNSQRSAISAFPGGLCVSVPPAGGGAREEIAFVSGGFAAIEITDASGRLAASFGQPITVTISVPTGTVNPETNAPVAAGDTIPFWSYDEATGLWKWEALLTVQPDGGSGLQAVGTIGHLSYFNLDWRMDRCPVDPRIVVSGNPGQLPLTFELVRPGGGFFAEISPRGDPNDVALPCAPAGTSMDVVARYNGIEIGRATFADLCGAVLPITVAPPAGTKGNLDVRVRRYCLEDERASSPEGSASVVVYRPGTTVFFAHDSDGAGVARFRGIPAGYAYWVSATGLDGESAFAPKMVAPGDNVLELRLFRHCDVTGGSGR